VSLWRNGGQQFAQLLGHPAARGYANGQGRALDQRQLGIERHLVSVFLGHLFQSGFELVGRLQGQAHIDDLEDLAIVVKEAVNGRSRRRSHR